MYAIFLKCRKFLEGSQRFCRIRLKPGGAGRPEGKLSPAAGAGLLKRDQNSINVTKCRGERKEIKAEGTTCDLEAATDKVKAMPVATGEPGNWAEDTETQRPK